MEGPDRRAEVCARSLYFCARSEGRNRYGVYVSAQDLDAAIGLKCMYNEIDDYPAQWLRNLIVSGHLRPGTVDQRSIKDINPGEINAPQAHFFAGIGGWPLALQLAGWPDDAEVWTGSCPCQPWSVAGKRGGQADERHLWPAWFRLIYHHRPPVIFGEQVAGKSGLEWLDLVFGDLESIGYTVGAADLCAAGIGAPHLRQRLYWVAYAPGERFQGIRLQLQSWRQEQNSAEVARGGQAVRLAAPDSARLEKRMRVKSNVTAEQQAAQRIGLPSPWGGGTWIECSDGKKRPIEPGSFPLAYGVPGRVGRLRAYGNAIVPQVAAEFVKAFIGVIQ